MFGVGLYDIAGESPPKDDGAPPLGGCGGASRRRRCSWYSTCTTVCTGSRSFCAACVHASRDSFWQSITLHAFFLSASLRYGCACAIHRTRSDEQSCTKQSIIYFF
uniref:Uncharacterized protein n=1 Tax=Arundo donax TaxID=35708 RepID=A0A0A9GQF3_ARUDO